MAHDAPLSLPANPWRMIMFRSPRKTASVRLSSRLVQKDPHGKIDRSLMLEIPPKKWGPRSLGKTPPKTRIVSFFGGFVCKNFFGTRVLKNNFSRKSQKYMPRDHENRNVLAERIFVHLTRAP